MKRGLRHNPCHNSLVARFPSCAKPVLLSVCQICFCYSHLVAYRVRKNWRQKRHSQCLKCACSGDRTNGALHPCPHDDMTKLTMVCKPYTLTVFLSLCCQQNKVKNPSSYATLSSPVKWRERSEARYATIRATGLGAADRMVRIFLRVTGGSVGRHGARTQSRPIRRTI